MSTGRTLLDSLPLAVFVCALWIVSIVAREWNQTQLDLTALFYASRFFALGQFDQVYDATSPILLWNDAPMAWQEMAKSLGEPTDGLTAYVYPPLWAWVISFASMNLSPLAFFNAANALFAVGFCAGLLAAARAFGSGTPVVVWVLVSLLLMEVSMIGQTSFQLGQPQTLVTGIILGAFAAYHRAMPVLAGGLLGLAAALKLSPIVFVVIFLVDRNWRALAAFTVIGGALGLMSIAVAGWPLHEAFLGRLAKMEEMILLSRINFSVAATVTYLIEGVDGSLAYDWIATPPLVGWISPFLTVLSVIAVFVLRQRERSVRTLVAALLVLGFAMPLSSPLGWIHYLLLIVAIAPAIISYMSPRQAAIWFILFGAVFSLAVFSWLLSQHMAVAMIYSTFWAMLFCLASFAFGLAGTGRRDA